LTTSATSYSAADIFAAGFQDHEIGPVMGVDSTTGGGGANVWFYRPSLGTSIPTAPLEGIPKIQLPKGIDLQFAARRCLRTGKHLGIPVEEIGVETETGFRHRVTRDDLVHGDVDLRKHAIRILSQLPHCHFEASISESKSGITATVRCSNVDRLDFYLDDRLAGSREFGKQKGDALDSTRFRRGRASLKANRLKIEGFRIADGESTRVVRYKHPLNH
jgi:hypothetical protein